VIANVHGRRPIDRGLDLLPIRIVDKTRRRRAGYRDQLASRPN
jgi:hypothetical protein